MSFVNNNQKSIIIIAAWFGEWPSWSRLFMLSCQYNPTVNWLILADHHYEHPVPANVSIRNISWASFKNLVSNKLDITYDLDDPYNVCNLRPMYGVIFDNEIKGYDVYGWCDIDVIWGNIRSFYNNDVLSSNIISSDASITTGHLLLVKNEDWLKSAYLMINGWRERILCNEICDWHESVDEYGLSTVFSPDVHFIEQNKANGDLTRYRVNNTFVQRFTTPFTPQSWHDGRMDHPEIWFWRDGTLFNERDKNRNFIYLHLMNFKSPRWINSELYDASPTWSDLRNPLSFVFDDDATSYVISRSGIRPER